MSSKQLVHLTVLRAEELTPHLRRIVLGDGPRAAGFDTLAAHWNGWADSYVKLAFFPAGYDVPDAAALDVVRAELPPQAQPVLRTYTVRRFLPEDRELWIDFVVHGDEGLAGPWAAAARPGDTIRLVGPGGAYSPQAEADHHLFVGDEAGLPAIASSLEQLPAHASVTVFCEVFGPDDEIALGGPASVRVHWLHRGIAPAGSTTLLDDAVRAWDWPQGRVQAFVHGESALLKTVRPYVRERVDRRDLSVSAYWRLGETEEGFRAWKSTQSEPITRPA